MHNSEKYTTFALEKENDSATIAIKLKPDFFMKLNVFTLKQQTQDFLLRLFVEQSGVNAVHPYSNYYLCAHAGTHARLHA